MQTQMKIIDGNDICRSNHHTPHLYCVIDYNMSSNIFYADTGDPLMYLDNERWNLYGIGSIFSTNSYNEYEYKNPSYFTRVPDFIDFIIESKKKLEDFNIVMNLESSTPTKVEVHQFFNREKAKSAAIRVLNFGYLQLIILMTFSYEIRWLIILFDHSF